jgi:hypothetical protein
VDLAAGVSMSGVSRSQVSMSEVFRWVLEEFRSELKGESLRKVVACNVGVAMKFRNISSLVDMSAILDIKLDEINLDDIDLDDINLDGINRDNTTINAAAEPGGFSILHYVIRTTRNSLNSYDLVNVCVGLGADVHRLGYNTRHRALFPKSCGGQSPTTIAMRCSNSFYIWRAMLVENEYCLNCFVVRELQNSPLASQGWTSNTLLALFKDDFRPLQCRCEFHTEIDSIFCRCGKPKNYPPDLEWQRRSEMIKLGKLSEVQELDHQKGTDGMLPRNCTEKSCLSCGHAMSAKRLTELIKCARFRNLFEDEGCSPPVFNWPSALQILAWQSFCDSCEAQKEVVLGSPATSIDSEDEEEDFQPRMPGGFDL